MINHAGYELQCPVCSFGPILHGGCPDLVAHHGEASGHGGHAQVSNACPNCGFFAEDIYEWHTWSQSFSETFLNDAVREKLNLLQPPTTSSKSIDTILRIIYSFRKFVGGDTKQDYEEFAYRVTEWDFRFTTKDGIDGLQQILIALLATDEAGSTEIQASLEKPAPAAWALITEACARNSRKHFRMQSKGDEGSVRLLAQDFVTDIICWE